ncbi:Chromosome transmission fidelity protein 18-like protein [Bienertia sinuspersici]
MEFPDLDELQWLEANQPDEDYPLEFELLEEIEEVSVEKHNYEKEDELFESQEEDEQQPLRSPPLQQSQSQIPSINEKKRPRSQFENDDSNNNNNEVDEDNRGRVRVSTIDTDQDNEKLLSRYAHDIEGSCVPITAPSASGLLSESVSVLLHNAEQDAMLKALQASSEVQSTAISSETLVMTEELWVNKYAPRSFTELLSTEQTNREVLSWLKQWDATVFSNGIKNTGDEVLSALRRHSSLSSHQKHSGATFPGKSGGPRYAGKYMGNLHVSEKENDMAKGSDGLPNKMQSASGTPDQKVLLLCGPPGLGKTTLAHVAAKHCGYHVVEINASDDRSSSTIETKILDAVQMNSIMAHSKPKCLVIDEIDGALGDGKGAIDVILKMVAAGKKSDVGNEASTKEQFGRKSLNKGRKAVSLSRPVICICNDLYAPALRPLRNVAKVHMFSQPTLNRVVNRLKHICNKEGMKTSSIALTALAEYTECDIRSCLNSLQFLHKKKESLNLVAISSQVIGRKDMTRSIFDVWKEVFHKKKMKQSRNCDVSPRKPCDTYDSLYSLVSNRGDYELIFDGIHENFLQLHYHDPLLLKTVNCLNALGVSDLFHQCVMRSHNMSLFGYLPFITITIHQLLARVETPTIEWPKSFHRYRSALMEKMEKLRSWQSKIAPCISRHLSVNSFVEDTISPLLDILSPADLRPVAAQLLSEKEKHDLAQLISTMVSYSLTYKNTKVDSLANNSMLEGIVDVSLSLDPLISEFVNFKGYKAGHYELKSAVKKVLMYEIEKQKIVQESISRSMRSIHNSQDTNAAKDEENGIPKSSKMFDSASDFSNNGTKKNLLQKEVCKGKFQKSLGFAGSSADAVKLKSTGDVKKPCFASFNFFDRFKKVTRKGCQDVDSSKEKLAGAEKDGHRLLFKFNEGFTNAVKRPVRIREFLS